MATTDSVDAPQQMFSWTVVHRVEDPPLLGAAGVCDDGQRAMDLLAEALEAAPAGTRGIVHQVFVSQTMVGYRYVSVLAHAVHDPASGLAVRGSSWFLVGHEGLAEHIAEDVRRLPDLLAVRRAVPSPAESP